MGTWTWAPQGEGLFEAFYRTCYKGGMKGVIYTRVSSDEQVEGTSLKSQDELCRKYCEQKGITVAAAFREEGESAKDLSLNNRSQFLAALEYCRVHKDVDAFVVYKVDRFARNTEDHFAVRRILVGYGTSLHSVTEPIGNKPAEKFVETVLAGAAEYDNAIRRQRCTDGMLSRMRQGIWPFRAPKGYVCAHHHMKGEKKGVPDARHPTLFPLIQRALRVYASGEVISQVALAEQLNAWGFADAYGKPATPQVVDRMLGEHLAFYAGMLVNPWTKEEYAGLHEAMITAAERRHIQQRRRGAVVTAPTQRTRYNPDFPLRRLLRCIECGRYLTGAPSRGNGGVYGYYYCTNATCALRSKVLKSNHVQSQFADFLAKLRPATTDVRGFEARLQNLLSSRGERSASEHSRRAQRRTALAERRKRVCEMREDGAYDQATFRERIAAIDTELSSLDEENHDEHTMADIDLQEVSEVAYELVGNLHGIWTRLVAASRSRFEQIFFPGGIRYDRIADFRTTELGLIYGLLGLSHDPKSREVKLTGFSSNRLYQYLQSLLELDRESKAAPADAGRVPVHIQGPRRRRRFRPDRAV
jgi:site-specific DNA recombinase